MFNCHLQYQKVIHNLCGSVTTLIWNWFNFFFFKHSHHLLLYSLESKVWKWSTAGDIFVIVRIIYLDLMLIMTSYYEAHRLIIKLLPAVGCDRQTGPLRLFQNQDKALWNFSCKLQRSLFRIMSSCKLISQYIGNYRNMKNRILFRRHSHPNMQLLFRCKK